MLRSDAQRNRALLIESACRLIAEVGSDAVSARDIAEHAGVSTATLYRHFTSKQALVDEISVDRWRRASAWACGGPGPQALQDIVTVLDRFSRMVSSDAQFITAAGLQVGRTPMAIGPVRQQFDERFRQLWSRARMQGQLRPWADPVDTMELVWAIRSQERRLPMLATVIAGISAPDADVDAMLRRARQGSSAQREIEPRAI